MKKKHIHKVTINEKRRENKKRNDLMSKSTSREELRAIFDAYYRSPLKALYRKIKRN